MRLPDNGNRTHSRSQLEYLGVIIKIVKIKTIHPLQDSSRTAFSLAGLTRDRTSCRHFRRCVSGLKPRRFTGSLPDLNFKASLLKSLQILRQEPLLVYHGAEQSSNLALLKHLMPLTFCKPLEAGDRSSNERGLKIMKVS
jgi:hypothetical protein